MGCEDTHISQRVYSRIVVCKDCRIPGPFKAHTFACHTGFNGEFIAFSLLGFTCRTQVFVYVSGVLFGKWVLSGFLNDFGFEFGVRTCGKSRKHCGICFDKVNCESNNISGKWMRSNGFSFDIIFPNPSICLNLNINSGKRPTITIK